MKIFEAQRLEYVTLIRNKVVEIFGMAPTKWLKIYKKKNA